MDPSSSQNQQQLPDFREACRALRTLEEQCAHYEQLPAVDQGVRVAEMLSAIQAQLLRRGYPERHCPTFLSHA